MEFPMTDTMPYGAGEGGTCDDPPLSPAPEPHAHLLGEYDNEAECAAGIKKSKRTLQRWRRLGMGPPVTFVGKTIMYRRASVTAWLIEQEREAGE